MSTKSNLVLALTFALFSALSPGCTSAKKTNADALAELQGQWRIESAHRGGDPMDMGFAYVEVHGDRMDRITTQRTYHRRIRVDAQSIPPTMDFEILDEKDKGQVMLGIYKIEQGKLWICHAPIGKPRPAAFISSVQDGNVLAVSKRPTPQR